MRSESDDAGRSPFLANPLLPIVFRKRKLVSLRSSAILPLPPKGGEGSNGRTLLVSDLLRCRLGREVGSLRNATIYRKGFSMLGIFADSGWRPGIISMRTSSLCRVIQVPCRWRSVARRAMPFHFFGLKNLLKQNWKAENKCTNPHEILVLALHFLGPTWACPWWRLSWLLSCKPGALRSFAHGFTPCNHCHHSSFSFVFPCTSFSMSHPYIDWEGTIL